MSTSDTINEQDFVSPTDEIDLSGEGLPNKEMPLNITDVERIDGQNGQQYSVTFEGDELPYPIKVRYWFTHTNPKAQQAGRAGLKKLTVAATGSAMFSPTNIIGRSVLGTPSEDDRGFPRVNRVRSVGADANTVEA